MDEWMDGWMDGWMDEYHVNNLYIRCLIYISNKKSVCPYIRLLICMSDKNDTSAMEEWLWELLFLINTDKDH